VARNARALCAALKDAAVVEALTAFVERRKTEGGAAPVS